MAKERSSRTAEGMALLRAIEASKPEAERICYDPITRSLVNGVSFTLSKLVIDSGLYERNAPGAVAFIIARGRYIDDFLKACLSEGLDQVVILGAGFDTRAYRIAGIKKCGCSSKTMQRAARVTGEGYLFGIDQGQIEPFLTQRGFHDVRNVTPEDLKRLYFAGPNAGRVPITGCDIVSARVKVR